MIDLSLFKGQYFAIFGLGKSSLATATALERAGAKVALWDDEEKSRHQAAKDGHNILDLTIADFGRFDGLILSPGVPLTHPKPHWVVDKAKQANLPIMGDIELFLRAVKHAGVGKIVAVTGTNGKSTTVSLIHHILSEAGLDAHLGGNIGSTMALDLPTTSATKIYILELSSYQIDLMPSLQKPGLAPDIAVLVNVSADHLDRHGDLKHYAQVKAQIFEPQTAEDLAIIGIDDEFGAKFADIYNAVSISAVQQNADIFCKNGQILQNGQPILEFGQAVNLQGVHNAQNTAIAYEIAKYFGVEDEVIKQGLHSFKGLEHRMEYVGKIASRAGDILFINDSKATNAEAVKPALGAYENVYWLAGGQGKQGGLQPLYESLKHIKKAYVFGQSAPDFADELTNITACEVFLNMGEAINKALTDIMHTGDDGLKVILLSPAAASFDQFDNFEKRGQMFKQMAKDLGAKLS
ncbi:MAG: UDP-N-acetylmuramoyl-L-alanine--D-glutamate ligase [Rhizobiales bacterium]|nr:UDP-N-acetylmuramoyl-L-alanine--D-glutamate ligase [Hyphomicrobiales bacterium]NRB13997.1 UDP-N-acetylmuramoyl-L-alanine--D-glutamate ligase [Hyphomicrobiales bacterium]